MGADSASWGPFMGGFEGVHVAPLTLPTSSGGWWEGWSLCKYHTPARVTRKPISGPQETRRVHACAQVWLRHLFVFLRIISTVLRHWSPLCSLPLMSLFAVPQRQILARWSQGVHFITARHVSVDYSNMEPLRGDPGTRLSLSWFPIALFPVVSGCALEPASLAGKELRLVRWRGKGRPGPSMRLTSHLPPCGFVWPSTPRDLGPAQCVGFMFQN